MVASIAFHEKKFQCIVWQLSVLYETIECARVKCEVGWRVESLGLHHCMVEKRGSATCSTATSRRVYNLINILYI